MLGMVTFAPMRGEENSRQGNRRRVFRCAGISQPRRQASARTCALVRRRPTQVPFPIGLVCAVFGLRNLDADCIDIAPLDDLVGELEPLEKKLLDLRLKTGLSFAKIGAIAGIKEHVADRIYQDALSKLRHPTRLRRMLSAVTPSWRLFED